MKHIFIGDIHGRDCWQQINIRKYDKIVFLGDYVDSSTLSDFAILDNLKKIISLKKRHPEKVILLIGNHDLHYMTYPDNHCSGLRRSILAQLQQLFRANRELFQIAYQSGAYLCTHAGLTNLWYQELIQDHATKTFGGNIADMLNHLLITEQRDILFSVGTKRGGPGNGGPIWADITELFYDMLNDQKQIVGHNKVQDILTIAYENKSVTFIDVLEKQTKFLELDI